MRALLIYLVALHAKRLFHVKQIPSNLFKPAPPAESGAW